MIGIYDCFGYGAGYNVPFEKRYKLIKQTGFDSVMLWWSDKFGRGTGYQQDVVYARNAELHVENIHAPVHEQNYLSSDNLEGKSVYEEYLQCVRDCAEYSIQTMVVHLPSDEHPISNIGLERIRSIVESAETNTIQIAFENLNNLKNLALVLNSFRSEYVGFCYDSCHHFNFAPDIDLLKLYGARLMALHLHDNGGRHNQHRLPFDGQIDWTCVMREITNVEYQGSTSLEPMNWDYEQLSIQEFLALAYQRAKRLDEMRNK